jgi:ribosomal protein L35
METKYCCEKCNFNCDYLSIWNQHLLSNKHTGNKRKERNDKILEEQCKFCQYKTTKNTNMKLHILTQHSSKEERAKQMKYYCEKCDFGTNATILFTRHLETQKHINLLPNI